MKSYAVVLLLSAGALCTVIGFAQSTKETSESHVAAAKAAARQEHTALFGLCSALEPAPPAERGQRAATQPQSPPDRSQWHAEPVKVFDNLYFVGMTEYSSWAVNTSDGIIIIDAIFDYSVEDEIAQGLPKLGLDPKKIKYVIVSHGHIDHAGGAKYLQDHFGAHVIMGGPDWDLLDRDRGAWSKPKRDMVAADGQKLTLGDTTLTLYLTPGHTPGTISTLIPVKDQGQPHLVAEWGGTAFNFTRTAENFQTYVDSAQRFSDIVAKAGADVVISNHTNYDGSKVKQPLLANRKPGDPNPYVVGNDSVRRYLKTAEECATAGLLSLQ